MKKFGVLAVLWGAIMALAGCALPVGDDYRSPTNISELSIIAEYNLRSYVPVPVAGETPVKAVASRTDMDIAVVWKDDQGVDITESLTSFVQNRVYQADITLTAKNGYAFNEAMPFKYIPDDLVEVQPQNNIDPAARSLSTVVYKPAQPPKPIEEGLDLTPYIPGPVTGATPVMSFGAPLYSGTVAWETTGGTSLAGPFLPGTAYKAVVSLTAVSGYVFTGLPSTGTGAFGHSGAASLPENPVFEIDPAKPARGTVTIVFNETALIPIGDYNLQNYVPVPVEGQRPVTEVNREEIRVTAAWYNSTGTPIPNPETATFILGAVYQADITVTAGTGYTFNPAENFRYIPDAAVTTQPGTNAAAQERNLSRVTYNPTAGSSKTIWLPRAAGYIFMDK
jgi:hypothetical protein